MGRWQMVPRDPAGAICSVAWSPDSRKLACAELGYVRICDAHTFRTQAADVGHTGRVASVDWNRATNQLATASYDGTVRIWSADGVPLRVIDPHQGQLAGSHGRRTEHGSPLQGKMGVCAISRTDRSAGPVIKASDTPVNRVAWSPDGGRLVSGDNNYLVKIWNADGSAAAVCKGHTGSITDVTWSPDGKRIASATWGKNRSALTIKKVKCISGVPTAPWPELLQEESVITALAGVPTVGIWP